LEYILKPGLNYPQPSDQKFPETILFNNASPLIKMNRFSARKGSPVLDTARMRSWLARRRWLKAGTVLRALQRMAKVVNNSASHSRKETQAKVLKDDEVFKHE